MRGNGYKSVVGENLRATEAFRKNQQISFTRAKLCWRCQKDKVPAGGHITTYKGGPMKFICRDCLQQMENKLKEKNDQT